MKKKIYILILLCFFCLFPMFSTSIYAEDELAISLEAQEDDKKESIRYISTLENATTLSNIDHIEVCLSLSNSTETKYAKENLNTVYSSISGTNGKEKKENTYYAVFTLTDIQEYIGYRLTVYFSYCLTNGEKQNTNSVSYDIVKTVTITYNTNGGYIEGAYGNQKLSFSIDYYNTGYWSYYASSIFLYDKTNENSLGALYSKRIGIQKLSGLDYTVTHIYNPGESDKNSFTDDYAIVIHTDNSNYDNLDTISLGDTIHLSSLPSSNGNTSISVGVYSSSSLTKTYTLEKLTSIVDFTIDYCNVTNAQYNSYASSKIMLNDGETEAKLGAKYSYRVAMNHYDKDTYIVEKIYSNSGSESDYGVNSYDYTLVVHSSYSAGFTAVKKISVGDLVEIPSIPSASTSTSISAKVYKKTEYDRSSLLAVPKKEGYSFKGWFTTEALTGEQVTGITSSSTLYAKWDIEEKIAYTTRTTTSSYIYGNDVSYYQGTIDYTKYKTNSNFMIARIGYSTDSDSQVLDSKFTTYVDNAKTQNIPLGLYIYSKADSVAEAKAEANWIISKLSELGYDKGTFSYPIYMDYEETSSISTRTKTENTTIVNTFCQTLIDAGYYPGLYMGGSAWNSYMNQEDVICDVWIAGYSSKNTIDAGVSYVINNYAASNKVTMIQFDDGQYNQESKSGSTLGTSSTYIDQDVCFVDYPTIIKERHFNGY